MEAIFNLECYKLAIAERGHYKAGCNLLWLNLTFSPLPHVPIRKSSVRQLKDHYFSAPQLYPRDVLVAISGPDQNPLGSLGSLTSVSPEELPATLLERIVDAIQLGAPHEELEAWRSVLLTATFHFEVLPSDNS